MAHKTSFEFCLLIWFTHYREWMSYWDNVWTNNTFAIHQNRESRQQHININTWYTHLDYAKLHMYIHHHHHTPIILNPDQSSVQPDEAFHLLSLWCTIKRNYCWRHVKFSGSIKPWNFSPDLCTYTSKPSFPHPKYRLI